MPAIDRWVISTAFGMLARQLEAVADVASLGVCAINVSGASIGDDDFLDFVLRAIRRASHAAFADLLRDHRDDGRRLVVEGDCTS